MLSAICATICCIWSIILVIVTEGLVMTLCGCCAIVCATVAVTEWRHYFDSRNKPSKP